MPRWYALCNGTDIPGCRSCRRLATRHPFAAQERQQAWTTPDLQGGHCNRYIEQPATSLAAVTPTDTR